MAAFRLLFEHYYPAVKAFSFGIVHNDYHAEEIAQNVFIGLWVKRVQIDPDKNFSGFIYRLARNEVVDYFRRESRFMSTIAMEMAPDIKQTQTAIESEIDTSLIRTRLDNYVETLPEQRRKVFVMSRYQGLSNSEIAEKLSLSKRTVERHLNIVLNDLKQQLGDFNLWLLAFLLLN